MSGKTVEKVEIERSAVRELLVVAAPTIAAMSSYTLMQFTDKLMVSRIGPDPIYVGAQGNGGLASFVPIAMAMGFLTVINTYVSQNLGARTPEQGPRYAWAGVWVSLAYWVVALVPFALALPWLFELIRGGGLSGVELADAVRRDDMATRYGRVLLFGACITLAARGFSQYFYGMHKAGVVLVATLAGNLTNLIFNSLLIYAATTPGWREGGIDSVLKALHSVTRPIAESLGIPALGILGAAVATLIGTVVELAIPLVVFLSGKLNRLYGTRRAWKPGLKYVKDLLRIGWPPALMFGNEMMCWAFFMVYLVGQFGPRHSTAGWIAHQWMALSFMPTVGISIAITASVGKCLGAKRPDLANRRAWTGFWMAFGYMGACGLLFLIFRREMVELFIDRDTPPEDVALLLSLGTKFLLATAAFQLFDAVAMTFSGALRGAGDTVWTGVVTLFLSWTLIVGGGLAMVEFFPRLESVGPWIAASSYIIVLSVLILARWLSGKWRSIDLLKKEGPLAKALASVEPVEGVVRVYEEAATRE